MGGNEYRGENKEVLVNGRIETNENKRTTNE